MGSLLTTQQYLDYHKNGFLHRERKDRNVQALLNKEFTSLTDLAYENEYFDQAHFIKEFKEFTGLTPKDFFGDDLKMSLIFDKK